MVTLKLYCFKVRKIF